MTIRRDPSTLHGAIEAAVTEAGGYAAAADIIAKPEKWLRDASNPDRDPAKAGQLTYAHARQLTRAGVLALAHDLAALAGMALVPMNAVPADISEIMAKSASLMGASGDAVATIMAALSDQTVTAAEKAEMTAKLLAIKRAAAETLAALGSGGG